MTARRDPDQLIRAYLEDGPTELPDRSYDAVRDRIDHTRQRVVLGPWREPRMSNFMRIAIAAALVLVVAVAGFSFLSRNDEGGLGVGATQPPGAPTPSPIPLPASGALDPRTYYIERTDLGATRSAVAEGIRITLTVPQGWAVDPGRTDDVILVKHPGEPGEVMLNPWVLTHIFRDGCEWDEEALVDAGTTVDELVSALADQGGREATAPRDTRVGGFPGKLIELTVPSDLDVTTCTESNQRYWPGPAPDFSGGLCCNPAGNTDAVHVIDVEGKRQVFVARHYPQSSTEDRAELQAIVDSIKIEP